MNVGIITYHRAHNYGAVLQAYALKKIIEKFGHSATFVDYWPLYHQRINVLGDLNFLKNGKTSYKFRIKKFIFNFLIYIFKRKKFFQRQAKFKSFIYTYFHLPNKSLFERKEQIEDNFDLYIYGSDQIWREDIFCDFGLDEVYFGFFPLSQGKKITYAVSTGKKEFSKAHIELIQRCLVNFDRISVREDSLKNVLQNLTHKTLEEVLDPVFLLDKADWLDLAGQNKEIVKSPKKFLLYYNLVFISLKQQKFWRNIVHRIAQEHKLQIIELNSGVSPTRANPYETSGPLDFISLIASSDFIISNSFHGVAFSIIFQKDFIAFSPGVQDTRIVSVLKTLNLLDRFFDNRFPQSIPGTRPINYKSVYQLLDIYKKRSIIFLKNSLNF